MKTKKGSFILVGFFPYPAAIFPLLILLCKDAMTSDHVAYTLIFGIPFGILFFLVCFIAALVFALGARHSAAKEAKYYMIMKLMQIPAYVVIFFFGWILMLTPFTFFFTFALFGVDVMAMILSFIVGARVISDCRKEGFLTGGQQIVFTIMQALFCIDMIGAIVVFAMTKKKNGRADKDNDEANLGVTKECTDKMNCEGVKESTGETDYGEVKAFAGEMNCGRVKECSDETNFEEAKYSS